jgi:hypothetical protein
MDNSETTATSDTRHRTMTNQNTTQKTKIMGVLPIILVPTKNWGERNIKQYIRGIKHL